MILVIEGLLESVVDELFIEEDVKVELCVFLDFGVSLFEVLI